jgi:hypothetical protein
MEKCRYRRSFVVKLFERFPISEHVPTACARVDALRSHGYTAEALRLAIAIVRTLKQGQIQSQQRWQDQQDRLLVNCTSSGVARNIAQVPSATEGWIGHPLDPIGCLFDTLAEASLMPDDQSRIQYYFGNNRIIYRLVRLKLIGCVCIFRFWSIRSRWARYRRSKFSHTTSLPTCSSSRITGSERIVPYPCYGSSSHRPWSATNHASRPLFAGK